VAGCLYKCPKLSAFLIEQGQEWASLVTLCIERAGQTVNQLTLNLAWPIVDAECDVAVVDKPICQPLFPLAYCYIEVWPKYLVTELEREQCLPNGRIMDSSTHVQQNAGTDSGTHAGIDVLVIAECPTRNLLSLW